MTPSSTHLLVTPPRWGIGTWGATALMAVMLTAVSVAVARSALSACGVSLFGVIVSNCERERMATVRAL